MANDFPLPPGQPGESYQPIPDNAPLPPPEENPTLPPTYQPPEPATAPHIKGSPFKYLVPVVGGLIVLGIIIFVANLIFSSLGKSNQKSVAVKEDKTVTINYWGLWEQPEVMKVVIAAFEKDNPTIKVNYQLQSHVDYQDRLQTSFGSQNPPDVARIHATWMPIFFKSLFPAPANTISATEIDTNFYPLVKNSVVFSDQVYGVPMNMDGLVLFTNSTIMRQAGITSVKTWDDLRSAASTLTKVDEVTGKITRAGVALGTTSNVRAWPDIVSLMLLQGGIDMSKPFTKTTHEAISYYTSFASTKGSWDETMPDSILAFANEKVAMMIAPLWVIPEIQQIIKQNGTAFEWTTSPVPQLPDSDPVNWASFWVEVVPKNAPNPKEAWKFVSFLSSAKAQQLLFETAVKARGSAQVPANKAAAAIAQQNPFAAPLVQSLVTAKSFYTASKTHDSSTALNARLIKYLEDGVNATAAKTEVNKIIETMSLGFNQVLSQYRLVQPIAAPTGSN